MRWYHVVTLSTVTNLKAHENSPLLILEHHKKMTEEKHVSSKSDKWTYVAGTEKNPENRYGKPGASINAYAPTATPPYDFSFLSHAAYGLEMYPNYLSKWDDKNIDELLQVLKKVEQNFLKYQELVVM